MLAKIVSNNSLQKNKVFRATGTGLVGEMRISLLILLFSLGTFAAAAQDLAVTSLRCEYKANPLGVEAAAPRLSWELRAPDRNVLQTGYRLLVADNLQALERNQGNIWDSRKVASDASIQVAYAGPELQPAKTYYWKVMVWDNKGRSYPWSKPAEWQMGLLSQKDWKGAQWIAYEKIPDSLVAILPADTHKDKVSGSNVQPLIRKTFAVKKPVRKATLFISGLGHFEASLNGKKIGDHFLDPGWTKYDKQALYVAFDLSRDLKQGSNALGVMLGNGFYYVPPVQERYRKLKSSFGYPKMISRLAIEYTDGTTENLVSDASWKTAPGPIVFSSIYGGEDYDATKEQKGWDTPAFNAQAWKPVVLVDGPPELNAQMAEPLKVMDRFMPKSIAQPKPGVWVYDLGQNASGIPLIRVQGKRGDTVRLYPGELLKEDGTVNQRPTGAPFYLQYVLKGEGVEEWAPRFTYYGYRYVQLEGGVPAGKANPQSQPVVTALTGLHTRNAAPAVGSFVSSSELFNKTYKLIDWAVRSNMASVLTDCPHREKLGWLEQVHLMGNSVRFNYDINSMYRKSLHDMMYSQTDSGLVPEIAPEYVRFDWGGGMFRDSPEWGSNSVILPWYLYQWYGDRQALEECYPMMQQYIAYLQTKADNHILSQGLGDWYDLGPKAPGVSQLTPMGVTGTAIFHYDLLIMQQVAKLLGKNEDAERYSRLAGEVKQAFNNKFYNTATKQYATGSQAANAMAVFMGLVREEDKASVVNNIVQDIRSRGNSLTAGDIGYRYLLKVLQEEGRSDVIYDMNSRSDVPGYGYQLARGATALTESWAALPTASNNHLMLGHLMEWFFQGLGGVGQADSSVAFRHLTFYPEVVGDVTFTKVATAIPYGQVRSEWKKEGDVFTMLVQVPVNTTATIYLPAKEGQQVLESGKPLSGASWKGFEKDRAVVKVGSGVYRFEVK